MEYKKIDRDFAYERMYDLTRKECPGKTEEFYKLVVEQRIEEGMRFWLKEYISDKLRKTGFYNQGQADRKAHRIMKDLPKELFPNVEEWLNDKPISEIEYGKMSIKRIMEQDKEETGVVYDFLTCANIMNYYIKSGCKDEWRCYEAFILG